MAKRKRLTPAKPDYFGAGFADGARAPETKSLPPITAPGLDPSPIARVAGEAATRAALDELSDAMRAARADGRMIERLALDVIDTHYLVRDRMEQDADDMAALMASIRARGQQTAIEVIELPDPVDGMTHGLISGWRRLTALRRLHEQTGEDRFATVKALVIAPETAQDAYVAMVEENEIRVNLSLYERARIAIRAVREGVYPTSRAALQGLFASTTRSKRSKVGTFITVVEALDPVLHHPGAIPEKLGLALARELAGDPGFKADLKARLRADPRLAAADELAILNRALADRRAPPAPPPDPAVQSRPRIRTAPPVLPERCSVQATAGVQVAFSGAQNRIELTGARVDEALYEALQDWLKSR